MISQEQRFPAVADKHQGILGDYWLFHFILVKLLAAAKQLSQQPKPDYPLRGLPSLIDVKDEFGRQRSIVAGPFRWEDDMKVSAVQLLDQALP